MDIEQYRNYCTSKNGATESFPFDENTLVFKVVNKIFALTNVEAFSFVNLKRDPEKSYELRGSYDGVLGAYHMNKRHWNSVSTAEDIFDQLMAELIDHPYDLVVQKLIKKEKKELKCL